MDIGRRQRVAPRRYIPRVLRFLKREYVELYPDLEVFADATRARDWPRLRQLIEALPSGADACVPLMIATEVRGSERFLAEVLRAEPDSVPARVLLGSRLIIQAWEARTAYSASSASNAQAEVFHERLRRADEVLAEAVELDPANPAAWSFRVTTARGLGLGLAERGTATSRSPPLGRTTSTPSSRCCSNCARSGAAIWMPCTRSLARP